MRILDKYIIKSFISPYIISFLIAEFVLVMQFMWKYIDDFAGRGLSVFDFMHLLFYYSITVIPMAVPITILIASVMVYGNLSEKYELSSMKSAGISLTRILSPGFLIALFTFSFSLSVSNYFKPKSAYKFMTIFTSIKRKKPTLNIQEKVFNKDFQGYSIQVNKKNKDGRNIEGIKIYNVSNRSQEKYNIITAKNGEIFTTEDGRFFIMKLYDGYQYVEQKKGRNNKSSASYPLMRTHYDTLEKAFDMSAFNKEGSGHFFAKRRDLMNSFQLMTEIDTFNSKIQRQYKKMEPEFVKLIEDKFEKKINTNKGNNKLDINLKGLKKRKAKGKKEITIHSAKSKKTYSNTFKQKDTIDLKNVNSFADLFELDRVDDILQSAEEGISFEKNRLASSVSSIKRFKKYRDYWILGLHQQYSWALICIIFLFIGAPLGSIIRKGGYGYPVLVAILFFTVFILLSISGEKLNRSMTFNPIFNAWLPVIVLFPVSVILTFKALSDSKVVNIGELTGRLYDRFKRNKNK